MPTPKEILNENGINMDDIGSLALFERVNKEDIPDHVKRNYGSSNKVYDPLRILKNDDPILNQPLPFQHEKEKLIVGELYNEQYKDASFSISTIGDKLTVRPHK